MSRKRNLSNATSRVCLAVFWLALLATPALARQTPRPLEIQKDDYREERVPRTQVSGTVRAGVLAGEIVRSIDPTRLLVRLPGGVTGTLCIEIRSANGEYHGRLQRSLDAVAPGDYRIALPTSHTAFFRAHDANAIAVLAFVAPDCMGPPTNILLTSWSDAIASDGFWVFLNANRNRAVVRVTDGAGQRQEFTCEAAPVDLAVIYDRRCRVTLPRGAVRTITIERSAGLGTRLPSISLPIRW